MAQAFADLETPLSLYLKLACAGGAATPGARRSHSFLLESVVGGERFGRYSFIGLPARTLLRAGGYGDAARTEVVTDGEVVETHAGNPLDFIAEYQARFRVALRPGMPRFCGGLAGYFGYDTVRHIEPRLVPRRPHEAGPTRSARPTSCCCSARSWPSSTTCRGGSTSSSTPTPAAPRPTRARERRLAELGERLGDERRRAGGAARRVAAGRARLRQGRLPRRGGARQGVHRRRRHDAGAGRPAAEEALHRLAAVALPRAALAQPVAVHVLLRHGRLPHRRRLARDPGAPGAGGGRPEGDDPPARRHAAARRHARARRRAGSRAEGRPEGARRARHADRPGEQRHRPHRRRPAA